MQLIVFLLMAFGLGYWVSRSKYHEPIDNALEKTKDTVVQLVRKKPADSASEPVKEQPVEEN
jgi:hypothetical protein